MKQFEFKKLTLEERKDKLLSALKNKTRGNVEEAILKTIIEKLNIENQFSILYMTDFNKFYGKTLNKNNVLFEKKEDMENITATSDVFTDITKNHSGSKSEVEVLYGQVDKLGSVKGIKLANTATKFKTVESELTNIVKPEQVIALMVNNYNYKNTEKWESKSNLLVIYDGIPEVKEIDKTTEK